MESIGWMEEGPMNVTEILKGKGTRVETTHAEVTVAEAARVLTDKHIGALLVCDLRGKVIGILSERDIVRGIAGHGPTALDLTVGEVMTERVISCAPEDDVRHVMAVMTNWRTRHLPVMAGKELRGILSIGDVVKNRLDETQLELNVLRDYARSH